VAKPRTAWWVTPGAPLVQQPQLIVVGSRGRGSLTGLLLGSTSHAVMAYAGCPVVVVNTSGE
jgi:nucleotide-binding universal stress UspA family protein